ncbi:hypothetical protein [Kitasatospora sp. NPDC002040]|uniref:hypothetical protein n=1 Tax=Kitasatospora sp. NPDC002040 TaxID=3154661 RepID=UPI003330E61A
MSLYRQTVVIYRAPYRLDRYGNATTERDWTRATATTVRSVAVQPDSTAEADGDRPAVTTGWRLITRRGVDLDLIPGDRVLSAGRLLETDGEVARWWESAGRIHHAEARLVVVAG